MLNQTPSFYSTRVCGIVVILSLFGITSCKKTPEIRPNNNISQENVKNNDTAVLAAVNADFIVPHVVPDDGIFHIYVERSETEVYADNERGKKFFSDLKQYSMLYKKTLGDKTPVQISNPDKKWSDVEKAVKIAPSFEMSSDEDTIQKLETEHKLRCHAGDGKVNGSYLAQLFYCVPADDESDNDDVLCNWTEDDNGEECDDAKTERGFCYTDNCRTRTANVYLSVLSSKDNIKRFFEINSNFEVSDGEVYDDVMGHYEIINDVSARPFMDTQGLYVRIEYYHDIDYENGGGSGFNLRSKTYTYLFAGDELHLVKSWEDSTWKLEYDRQDHGDSETRSVGYKLIQNSMSYDGENWTQSTVEEKEDSLSKEIKFNE